MGWVDAGDRIARRRGADSGLPLGALPELARAMALAPGASVESAEQTLVAILHRHPFVAAPVVAASAAAESTRALAGLCNAAIADELDVAGQESEREVLAAGSKLAKIYRDLSEHASALKSVHSQFSSGEQAGAESFGGVLAGQATRLSTFPAAFDDVRERVTQQSDMASKASENTSRILALATTVEKITTTINILGINALITAVHAGEHGAAFAVVANELRQLSSKTKQANESIASLARDLTKILPRLSESGAQITELCRKRSGELDSTIVDITTKLQSTYRALQSSTVSAIEDAAARGTSISTSCNEVLSHLMFQDRLQQHLVSATKIADLWAEAEAFDDGLGARIQKLRVGTERLSRQQDAMAPRPSSQVATPSPAAPSSSEVPEVEAGELSFL